MSVYVSLYIRGAGVCARVGLVPIKVARVLESKRSSVTSKDNRGKISVQSISLESGAVWRWEFSKFQAEWVMSDFFIDIGKYKKQFIDMCILQPSDISIMVVSKRRGRKNSSIYFDRDSIKLIHELNASVEIIYE